MQEGNVYSVDLDKSPTFPLPLAAPSPLGQSTAHSNVKIAPLEPVIVVRFWPGHGFEAIPDVPDVTGPDNASDAVDVVVEPGIDDVDSVNDVLLIVNAVGLSEDTVVSGDNVEVSEAGVDEPELLCDT